MTQVRATARLAIALAANFYAGGRQARSTLPGAMRY